VSRSVLARAPTRIDFGGGWTDVPPYPETDGGFVCNLAIARHASVRVRAAEDSEALTSGVAPESRPLVAAAIRRAGLRGVDVELRSDFPIGAGLGGSSAAGVALQGAIAAWRNELADLRDAGALAERSRDVEVLDLGVAGGRQDHYAAAFGGALGLSFTRRVEVRRIKLDARVRAELEERLVLIYTGQSRISGETVTSVIEAYRARDRRVVSALARMKALAEHMSDALAAGDLSHLGALVGEHWRYQRALHPAITTERIEAIMERGRASGALGGKALGASGGGCVLVIAPEERADDVRRAAAGVAQLLPFTVSRAGFHVVERH
jgi:D-glycero-alpha-D-manno-heptose-7-phosphate kinase